MGMMSRQILVHALRSQNASMFKNVLTTITLTLNCVTVNPLNFVIYSVNHGSAQITKSAPVLSGTWDVMLF